MHYDDQHSLLAAVNSPWFDFVIELLRACVSLTVLCCMDYLFETERCSEKQVPKTVEHLTCYFRGYKIFNCMGVYGDNISKQLASPVIVDRIVRTVPVKVGACY